MDISWKQGKIIAERFKLIKLLGHGALREVWLAADLALNRNVAIKIVSPAKANEHFLKILAEEARITAAISHPNVIIVYDVGRYEDQFYIVFQFIPGKNLSNLIEKKTLSIKQCTSIALDLAYAVQYAHSKNIIHRDIKPHNVIIESYTEKVILGDFSISERIVDNSQNSVKFRISGTPSFMPPEQFTGYNVDKHSDIYALGSTFYYMFAGQMPYKTCDISELISKKMHESPENPRNIRKEIPKEISDLIMKMMAPYSKDRPKSMDEIVTILESVAEKFKVYMKIKKTQIYTPKTKRKKKFK